MFYLRFLCIIICCQSFLHTAEKTKWYRGNTHCHTTICGHADSTPEAVTQWYHDRGYNFLILSEHNHFIDPQTVSMPANKRKNFILVPGLELTEKVHSTSMNITELVKSDEAGNKKRSIKEIIQAQVDRTREKKGELILNHPNYQWAVKQEDMLGINNLRMFELFNGHPAVHNHGDHEHPSTEKMWDFLLSSGMVLYGVSSDDAHAFKASAIKADKSNPGRGWVMVKSKKLNSDAITDAMMRGQFYASNGVLLRICQFNDKGYSVEIDVRATANELASPILRGKKIEAGKQGFRIEWIGKGGVILKTVTKKKSTFNGKKSHMYIRPRIVCTRKHPQFGLEEYYAWGQPQFMDDRLEH